MRKPQHSLAEQALARMKQDIIRCYFRPGSVLKEGDLADRYGMSKTPIREALSLLRRDGFIEVLPRRGILVRSVELQDIQNTFLLRMQLEPEAAALAAARATKEQLKRIDDLCDALSHPDAGESPRDLMTLHRTLHEAIAEASGIRELVPMIRTLHEKVEWFYNYERLRVPLRPTQDDTRALVDAIIGGDAERARTLIAENIRSSRQHLIDLLIRDPQLTVVGRSA